MNERVYRNEKEGKKIYRKEGMSKRRKLRTEAMEK
jgi:hypothetical protein